MTQTDRALPRRTATPEAETSPSALGLVGAPALYVSTDADLPDGPDAAGRRPRRAGAFRTILTLAFVSGAIAAGFAAGGGLTPPAVEPYAAAPSELAGPVLDDAPAADTTTSAIDGDDGDSDSIIDAMFAEPSAWARGDAPDRRSSTTSSTAPSTTSSVAPAPPSTAPKPKAIAAVTTTVPAKPAATTSTTAKPVATVPPTTTAPPTTAAPIGGNDAATLACIRARESGGNYSVVSANGLYFGAYQFMLSTWDSTARHAGRGDLVGKKPNLVAPSDQDAMALHLLRWQGLAPWGGYCR